MNKRCLSFELINCTFLVRLSNRLHASEVGLEAGNSLSIFLEHFNYSSLSLCVQATNQFICKSLKMLNRCLLHSLKKRIFFLSRRFWAGILVVSRKGRHCTPRLAGASSFLLRDLLLDRVVVDELLCSYAARHLKLTPSLRLNLLGRKCIWLLETILWDHFLKPVNWAIL